MSLYCSIIFFFNDTATTEIYTLSLHDALPICWHLAQRRRDCARRRRSWLPVLDARPPRSEEHTSELQSQSNLVCRLLLEKKKQHHHRGNYHHDDPHDLELSLGRSTDSLVQALI